jgi:hypothetical protein
VGTASLLVTATGSDIMDERLAVGSVAVALAGDGVEVKSAGTEETRVTNAIFPSACTGSSRIPRAARAMRGSGFRCSGGSATRSRRASVAWLAGRAV